MLDIKNVSSMFKSWDGVLDSGENDASPERLSGSAFGDVIEDSSSPDHPFISHDCNNILGVKFADHKDMHLGLKFPIVNDMLNIGMRVLKEAMRYVQTANDEPNFSIDQMLVNYGLWQLPAHMYVLLDSDFDRFPGNNDTIFTSYASSSTFEYLNYGMVRFTGLPNTCNFLSVLEGTCDFAVELGDLFNDTSTVKTSIHQCKGHGSKFGLPAFGITLGSGESATSTSPTAFNLLKTLNM